MLLSLTGLLCPSSIYPDSYDLFSSSNYAISLMQNGKLVSRVVSSSGCVCGREANELQESIRSIVRKLLKFDSSPETMTEVSKIQQILFGVLPETSGWDDWQSKKYATGKDVAKSISRLRRNSTYASQRNRSRGRTWQSFSFSEELLVAVTIAGRELDIERMLMIHDSWGLDVSQTVFYVSANVTREYEEDLKIFANVIQIDKSLLVSPLAVLHHLYDHYLDRYKWFLLAGNGNVYVRGRQMEEMLSCMDPEQEVYLGHPTVVTDSDGSLMCYCTGGPGIILSRAALRSLLSTEVACSELAQLHGRSFTNMWSDYDRELGRCIKRTISISCANGEEEANVYFFEDAESKTQRHPSLWEDPSLANALTVSPVISVSHMMTLHYFFKTLDHSRLMEQVRHAEEAATEACRELPSNGLSSLELEGKCQLGGEECPKNDAQACPQSKVVENVPIAFQPTFRYHIISWKYFDNKFFYLDQDLYPKKQLKVHKFYNIELQNVRTEMLKTVKSQFSNEIELKRITNGFFRHDGNRGNEYIIEAEFFKPHKPSSVITVRVELTRPLASNYITYTSVLDKPQEIHFIVPISKVGQRFDAFLQMYEQLSLVTEESTHLIVAVFGDDSDFSSISGKVDTYREKYPSARYTIAKGDGEFSRAKALHFGMSKLHSDDLAFFCDVDISVSSSFLDRCRRNTVQGRQIYYPEVFKHYDMKYVYLSQPVPASIPIKRPYGHWAYYAYGMACIYNSDYKTVGGFSMKYTGWGDEDVDLYERILKRGIDVFRVPDVGLTHRWHPKVCDKGSLPKKQYKHCMASLAEDLADRQELAHYILDAQDMA